MSRIVYRDNLEGITAEMLSGFFVGWRARVPDLEKHLQILKNAQHVVLALDEDKNRVVGRVNCLTDGIQSAHIPLLEVLPEYKGQGIGTQLMTRMLGKIRKIPAVDLTCDPEVQPFYERFEMLKTHGMALRNY
jgi:ribosomal protein S18 acetylase RimI-like enzyme